jgi:hypothetical protein
LQTALNKIAAVKIPDDLKNEPQPVSNVDVKKEPTINQKQPEVTQELAGTQEQKKSPQATISQDDLKAVFNGEIPG